MQPTTMYVECTKEADVNQQCTVVILSSNASILLFFPLSRLFFFWKANNLPVRDHRTSTLAHRITCTLARTLVHSHGREGERVALIEAPPQCAAERKRDNIIAGIAGIAGLPAINEPQAHEKTAVTMRTRDTRAGKANKTSHNSGSYLFSSSLEI